MSSVFIVFQVLLVVLITIAVLLQKSSSIGLGAYSGSNESLFGAKGPAGFLAKFTFVLGLLLVANTIALTYTYNTAGKDSVAEKIAAPSVPATPSTPNDAAAPSAPINEAPSPAPQAPTANDNAPSAVNQAPAAASENSQNSAPSAPNSATNSSQNPQQSPVAPNLMPNEAAQTPAVPSNAAPSAPQKP